MLRSLLLTVVLASLTACVNVSLAAGPYLVPRPHGASQVKPPRHYHGHHHHHHHDCWNWYPKYYGGFHARYYQRFGMPSGDVGIRGEAW